MTKIIFNPLTGKFDYVINKLTELSVRNHNDLQNRNTVAAHPAEAVGVLSPSSMFPLDIGKNWNDLGIPLAGGGASTLLPFGNGIVVGFQSEANNIRSTDYGATWVNTGVSTFPPTPLVRAYLGNGIGLIGTGGNSLNRTTDFGLTWTGITIGTTALTSIVFIGMGIVIVVDSQSPNHIWRSADDGLTWTDLGAYLTAIFPHSIAYFDNGIVIITSDNNLIRSTDYGLTWGLSTILPVGTRPFKMIYLGNGIGLFGTTDSTVFRSTDYGLTWINVGVTLGCLAVLSGDFFGNGVVVFGGEGVNLSRSTDYGLTWTTIPSSILGADDLVYIGNGVGLIYDDGSHIFRSDIAYKLDVGTRNHNDLQNRDATDAHPEASITKTTYADATLSGAPIIVKVDIGGTPYYFKAYPTKA